MRTFKDLLISLFLCGLAAGCVPPPAPTPAGAPAAPPTSASASAPAGASAGAYTVTDALGRTVSFSQPPQRIVLSGKALFMIADAIYLFPEAGQHIVALGPANQGTGNFLPLIDPNFSGKGALKSDAGPEQIAAAQPDCVVLKSSVAGSLGKPLEALKIPVVYVDFETPDQYHRDLKTLGQLFQNEARAEALWAFYQARLAAVTQPLATLSDAQKPRVLVLYYTDKDGAVAFNVPPLTWMQTLMVQNAGGRPTWQDANPQQGWTKVSLEQVAAWDADMIFVVAYANPIGEVVQKLKTDPQWQALRAVKDNHLYGFAADLYSWDQPDSRWILGQAWMARKLHPDLFANLDLTHEAQTFYQTLYGLDAAAFQKNIQPALKGDLP